MTVVSPEFCPELEKETAIERMKQNYAEECLEGALVVVVSTNNEEIDKKVYFDAVKKGLLVNVVDRPDFCTFIVPASIVRGDICISISTGGASPALARNIRKRLEEQFGNEYGEFGRLLSEMRKKYSRKSLPNLYDVISSSVLPGWICSILLGRKELLRQKRSCWNSFPR